MWVKVRAIFGLFFLMAGTLLVFQDKLPANSCGKWFAVGNSVSQVHHLIESGRELIAQKDWDGAAKKFEEAAKHCEENAGHFLIARANLLAFYTNEKQGRAKEAIHFADRAERLLAAIPKEDRNYANAQRVLKGIRVRLARLRPLDPIVQSNLITPPPINEPIIPQAYRRAEQQPKLEQQPKQATPVPVEPKELARKSPEIKPVEPKPLVPEPPARRPTAPTPPMAVRITSFPIGAEVTVNGEQKGVTPLVLKGLKSGKHQVDVHKKFHTTQTRLIRLAPGARLDLNFKLVPNKQNAHFEKRKMLLAQKNRKGPKRASRTILAAKPRKRATLRGSRTGKPGGLIVESRPDSMAVRINGIDRGRTPLTVKRLHPGLHKVEVNFPDQADKTQRFEVNIQPGKTARLNVVMKGFTDKELARKPAGSPRLDGGNGKAVKNSDGAPSNTRVAYMADDSSHEGRSVTEVTPGSELPTFMRSDNPAPQIVVPESQTSGQQSNTPKSGSGQQGSPAVKGFPSLGSLLTHKMTELGLIGIGLVFLTSSWVGWRKRQGFLKPSEDTEDTAGKVMIYDLDKNDEESNGEVESSPPDEEDVDGLAVTTETGEEDATDEPLDLENTELPEPESEPDYLADMGDANSSETPAELGGESEQEAPRPAPAPAEGENLTDPGEFGDDEAWAESVLGEMGGALADEIEPDEAEPLTLSKLQAEKLEERNKKVEEEVLDEENESETEEIEPEENHLTLSKMQAMKKEELSIAQGSEKEEEEATAR